MRVDTADRVTAATPRRPRPSATAREKLRMFAPTTAAATRWTEAGASLFLLGSDRQWVCGALLRNASLLGVEGVVTE